MYSYLCLFALVAASFAADPFGVRQSFGQIHLATIYEASGIAISAVHNDVMYVHNDKVDINQFFAVEISSGNVLATFTVNNAQNHDWEDMSYGPCADDCAASPCSAGTAPTRYCIYIGDIGFHGLAAKNNVYMIREPATIADAAVDLVDTLSFTAGHADAETLLLAPDGRLFIITKVTGGTGSIVELPTSGWGANSVPLDMSNAGTLKLSTTYRDPLGGAISPDGKDLVIVAEEAAYYFSVPNGDYINVVNTTAPTPIANYLRVPATQAVTFSPSGDGAYFLSEGHDPIIYFYPRQASPVVG